MQKALSSVEEAGAYLVLVEQIELDRRKHHGVVYALQKCQQSIIQLRTACTGLLQELNKAAVKSDEN